MLIFGCDERLVFGVFKVIDCYGKVCIFMVFYFEEDNIGILSFSVIFNCVKLFCYIGIVKIVLRINNF